MCFWLDLCGLYAHVYCVPLQSLISDLNQVYRAGNAGWQSPWLTPTVGPLCLSLWSVCWDVCLSASVPCVYIEVRRCFLSGLFYKAALTVSDHHIESNRVVV